MVDLAPAALSQAVETMGFASVGVGFVAGLVFSFNPVAVAAIPVPLAYVTRAREIGSPWLGTAVLLAFAVGRAVPIMLSAWSKLAGGWKRGPGWNALAAPSTWRVVPCWLRRACIC